MQDVVRKKHILKKETLLCKIWLVGFSTLRSGSLPGICSMGSNPAEWTKIKIRPDVSQRILEHGMVPCVFVKKKERSCSAKNIVEKYLTLGRHHDPGWCWSSQRRPAAPPSALSASYLIRKLSEKYANLRKTLSEKYVNLRRTLSRK